MHSPVKQKKIWFEIIYKKQKDKRTKIWRWQKTRQIYLQKLSAYAVKLRETDKHLGF